MPETSDISNLFSVYVIPWAINIAFAIAIFFVGRMALKVLVKLLRKILAKAGMDNILVDFTASILHSIMLLFIIIAALDQLGVNTTSLIAVIGAAGLAVGLALQSSLQNFASGVMLIFFRPFKAGDFVEAAGTSGTVETISIFNTIMRTADNREIIVPKRKLGLMVAEGLVSGWDDPRMPTLAGLRRRGFTPESIRDLLSRIGMSKADNTVDFQLLQHCLRDDLNRRAPRVMVVLDPLKVVIENYPEGRTETMTAVNNPEDASMGTRELPFGREIYIERDDFREEPPKSSRSM